MVEGDKEIELLQTIPGCGRITAWTIRAYTDDIKRFLSAKHDAAFVGVVPYVHNSNTSIRHGKITKHGPEPLRTAFVQLVMGMRRMKQVTIYDKGKKIYSTDLIPKEETGEYFIQKFRYISSIMKDTHRDLVFIYSGCCPPELYILYCQPKQYTEGHKMVADEKYDILDTGIKLEEFEG